MIPLASTSPKPPATAVTQNLAVTNNTQYTVFISHAGEDKATIAIPLRKKLADHGISAFVDEADLQPGTEAKKAMISAMEAANVAVIVLSPEFVARKWPMKEAMYFLERRHRTVDDTECRPVVIPFFYRLSITELYDEPRFDRVDKDGNLLYVQSRFHERMENGEPEASISRIKAALQKLHGIMGVRNDVDATNDSAYMMSYRREILVQTLCEKVIQAVPKGPVQGNTGMREARGEVDRVGSYFYNCKILLPVRSSHPSSSASVPIMAPVFIDAKPTPATPETPALAALVPASVAPPKSVTDLLEEVLALCQNPDVVSFLFTEDKIQLPYLTSPSFFSTAVTCTTTGTGVELNSSGGCAIGPLAYFNTCKWVFVPTFSVNGLSLGFGMRESKYIQAGDGDFSTYMRAEFRFVGNDAKGEVLVLLDIPEKNASFMEHIRIVEPTCRSRTTIWLHRDKLREIAKSRFIDLVKVLPALDSISAIYDHRDCPKCHLGHTACRCTLQLAGGRHPFDHSTFLKNMMQIQGKFEGVSSKFCYAGGRFNRKTALRCRTTLRCGTDNQLITSMRDWAVGLHMKGTESPLQTIVAFIYRDSDESTVPSTEETEEICLSLGQAIEPDALWLDDGSVFADSALPADTGIPIEELKGQTADLQKDVQPLIDLMEQLRL